MSSTEEINNTTAMTSAVVEGAGDNVADGDGGDGGVYLGGDLIDLTDSQGDYFRLYDANDIEVAAAVAGSGGGGGDIGGMLDDIDEAVAGESSVISDFIMGIWNPLNISNSSSSKGSNETGGNLTSMNPVSDADFNLTTWTSSLLQVDSSSAAAADANATSSALAAAVNAVSTASYTNYSAQQNSTTTTMTTSTMYSANSSDFTDGTFSSSSNSASASESASEYGNLFSTVAQAIASAASSSSSASSIYDVEADVADDDIALIDSAETAMDGVGSDDTDYGAAAGGFINGGNNVVGGGSGSVGDDALIQQSIAYARGLAQNDSFHQSVGGGSDKGSTAAANGGSTFMLLLEDFGEYFYNYNGSTVSGTSTTIITTTIGSSNITDYDYRTNCTNFNSTTETCLDISEVDPVTVALVLMLFPLLTLFGNILVIMSVCRERSLQTATNYYIVSLAIADLLVAVVVMPFAVYVLYNGMWALPNFICDFYIAMDVICSTSSIFNLVAISLDRFMAVTQPIYYAQYKSNRRVSITILMVWVISVACGLPIVLGLNNTPNRDPDLCIFYNTNFIIFSSMVSFYIPTIMMVFLYWNIFRALRNRARKQRAARRPHLSELTGGSVIENIAQTRRLAETALDSGRASGGGHHASRILPDEPATNTASGSNEEEDENAISPDIDDCHVIVNDKSTEFMLATVVEETGNVVAQITTQPQLVVAASDPNGNHDSGYAPSNVDDVLAGAADDSSPPDSPVPSGGTLMRSSRRNTADGGGGGGANSPIREAALSVAMKPLPNVRGGVQEVMALARNDSTLSTTSKASSRKDKKNSQASRFTIYKANKASKKKREKSSAKKERKATKTLAIVLGVFLFCWVPFFTCNMMDAMCAKFEKDCRPGVTAFILTTWLGYMNSFVNPVIYTIFNPEFRKAFKKIMHLG